MIIIDIGGGIANQLYGYFSGYNLAQKYNQKLVLNISTEACWRRTEYVLDLFNLPRYPLIRYTLYSKEMEEQYNKIREEYQVFDYFQLDNVMPEDIENCIQEGKSVWMRSFLMDEKNIKGNGLSWCDFFKPTFKSTLYETLLQEINQGVAVGVHVRRTDFVYSDSLLEIEKNYVKAAIQYYKNYLGKCKFYIFSDEIEYAKQELGMDSSFCFMSHAGGIEGDVIELLCLSLCKHKILSNASTFSTFSDLLTESKDKTCIFSGETEDIARLVFYNENNLLFEQGLSHIKYITPREIEELCKAYKTDNVNNGYGLDEIAEVINCNVINKQEAVEWEKSYVKLVGNTYALNKELERQLTKKHFSTLVLSEQYAEAYTLAYRKYFWFMEDKEFTEAFIELLYKQERFFELTIELAKYKYLFMQRYDASPLCLNGVLEEKIDFLVACKRYEFIYHFENTWLIYRNAYDATVTGEILRVLGNLVSFCGCENRLENWSKVCYTNNPFSQRYLGIDWDIAFGIYKNNLSELEYLIPNLSMAEEKRIFIVESLEALEQCIMQPCKKVVFRYNKYTDNEKEKTEELYKSYRDKILFVFSESPEFKEEFSERRTLENLYLEESYNYEFVYQMLKQIEACDEVK